MSAASVTITTGSEAETESLAERIAATIGGGTLLALDGPLGAGKTRFTRGVARGLGIDPGHVSSPTFVLSREYGPGTRDLVLVHVDAYRLGGTDELDTIGWTEFAGDPDVVTLVEWASRIGTAIPPDAIRIEIAGGGAGAPEDDVTREVVVKGRGRAAEAACEAAAAFARDQASAAG